jgi:hypothetical protein
VHEVALGGSDELIEPLPDDWSARQTREGVVGGQDPA